MWSCLYCNQAGQRVLLGEVKLMAFSFTELGLNYYMHKCFLFLASFLSLLNQYLLSHASLNFNLISKTVAMKVMDFALAFI